MNMDKCAKRDKGMGSKTQNFHGTKHAAEQAMWFGVWQNSDTMPNEQQHRRDKKSAKCTNQRAGI